ncbi:MAG: glycosyltransferase [Clostridia bacterium]|nr:glycosyltransferase [Clostridia bacterium]
MTSKNLISVIIPVYKVEEYIDKCIQSVVNQTYKNLEIILIDDGSPDNCPKICDQWAKKDGRIKVVHKPNGGVSSARNCGLDMATGDYVTFVDSDDFIELTMYEKLISSIIENNSDLALCGFCNVYENGIKEVVVEKNLSVINASNIFDYYVLSNSHKIDNIVYLDGIMAYTCRALYSKKIIKNNRFEQEIKYCEDLLFNLNVIDKNTKISVVNENLYNYYQRVTSAVHNASEKTVVAKFKYLEKVLPILENKISDDSFKIFKFSIYKIIYLDLLKTGSKTIYKKYIKELKSKKLINKICYKLFKRNQTGFANKLLAFLVYHNSYAVLKMLLYIKSNRS